MARKHSGNYWRDRRPDTTPVKTDTTKVVECDGCQVIGLCLSGPDPFARVRHGSSLALWLCPKCIGESTAAITDGVPTEEMIARAA